MSGPGTSLPCSFSRPSPVSFDGSRLDGPDPGSTNGLHTQCPALHVDDVTVLLIGPDNVPGLDARETHGRPLALQERGSGGGTMYPEKPGSRPRCRCRHLRRNPISRYPSRAAPQRHTYQSGPRLYRQMCSPSFMALTGHPVAHLIASSSLRRSASACASP